MAAAEIVRARIDSELKQEASAILAEMGLSVSDAIRLLFVRVVSEKALPFELRVPNAKTQAAIRDAREGRVTRVANVDALFASLNAEDDLEGDDAEAGGPRSTQGLSGREAGVGKPSKKASRLTHRRTRRSLQRPARARSNA